MQIAFLFYDGMTALDAVGPHEILCRLPYISVKRAAQSAGKITSVLGCTENRLFCFCVLLGHNSHLSVPSLYCQFTTFHHG